MIKTEYYGENGLGSKLYRTYSDEKKYIKQVETNIVYNSIGEASRITGINRTAIINNLKNRSKSAGGYKWIYKK